MAPWPVNGFQLTVRASRRSRGSAESAGHMKTILFLLGMAWAVHSPGAETVTNRSGLAPAPLYRDPVHDGAAEIEIDLKAPTPEFTAEHIPSIPEAAAGLPASRKAIRNFTACRDTDGDPISCHDGGITAVGDTLFAMCDQWFRGPQGERVPIDKTLQLWLPVTFDPQTGVARMQRVNEWQPFGQRSR